MSFSTEKPSAGDSGGDNDVSSFKRTCVRSSMDPDVVVVVGGVEFNEYSQSLCAWSDYFDAALRCGMKEAHSKRFEFPDRDPKEWEMILALAAPFSECKLTDDNVHIALSWFDELCSRSGLKACDRYLAESLKAQLGCSTSLLRDSMVLRDMIIRSSVAAANYSYSLPKTKKS